MVKKRAGENIIAITDGVDELLEKVQPTWPNGTEITKLMDKAKDTRNKVADLENNHPLGACPCRICHSFCHGYQKCYSGESGHGSVYNTVLQTRNSHSEISTFTFI